MKGKNILAIFVIIVLFVVLGYALVKRAGSTPATYDTQLAACGAFPNNSTQQETETSRVFINLPKNFYGKNVSADFKTISGDATAGYVSNGGQPGEGLQATADCWSTYYELDGTGQVDLTVPGMAGAPTYVVHFVVTQNAEDAQATNAASSTDASTDPVPQSALRVDSISPTFGTVGEKVTISGTGFAATNTVLFDGNVAAKNLPPSSTDGHQILQFTVPSSVGPDCKPGEMCAMYLRKITPGTYTVTVENEQGTSNSLTFTVQ